MKLYIPSFLGDIQLINEDEKTKLVYSELTPGEEARLTDFLKHYKITLVQKSPIYLPEKINKAHKRFLKIFKTDKQILNVAKYHDGKITLVQEFNVPETEAGVSVEQPPRGCPMPTLLERAETRALEVLNQFLSPQQKSDFDTQKAFVVRGNFTGRPYRITSRWNPACEQYGLLYCIPTQNNICASLPDVPPSEEVLAMKFAVEFTEHQFIGNI
ncbi:MAG TPA: hypothetical protein ENI27_02845 [bacterium]|nr:hypothetical protein [bacterium]